jgi:hypothetical protein
MNIQKVHNKSIQFTKANWTTSKECRPKPWSPQEIRSDGTKEVERRRLELLSEV